MSWRESSAAMKAGDFRKLFEAFSGAVALGGVAGEAHLTGAGRRREARREEIDPLDLRLAELEREIERRRRA